MVENTLTLVAKHDVFMEMFGLASAIGDVAILTATPDGLTLGVLNESKTAMVQSKVKQSAFVIFVSTVNRLYGLNIKKVADFLKRSRRLDKDSVVELSIADDNQVTIRQGRVRLTFGLEGDVESVVFPDPLKMKFSATGQLHVDELRLMVDTVHGLSAGNTTVIFKVDDTRLTVKNDDQTNHASIEGGKITPQLDEAKNGYSIAFASSLLKSLCDSLPDRTICFYLGSGLPIYVRSDENNVFIEAMIAPMVDV